MAFSINPINLGIPFASFMSTIIDNSTWSAVLVAEKQDTYSTDASGIESRFGALWGNVVDSFIARAWPVASALSVSPPGVRALASGAADDGAVVAYDDNTNEWTPVDMRVIDGAVRLPHYTVATLPSASPASRIIFVTDESGGPIPAYSDGTDWRRTSDRAVVS
jgi:hypothetical protein